MRKIIILSFLVLLGATPAISDGFAKSSNGSSLPNSTSREVTSNSTCGTVQGACQNF